MLVQVEIRAELARKKITYAEVAKKLKTTRQKIWRILGNDKRAMSAEEIKTLADILEIPAWELMRRAEQNQEEEKEEEDE